MRPRSRVETETRECETETNQVLVRPSPKAQEIVIEISVLSVVRCTKEQDAAVTDKL